MKNILLLSLGLVLLSCKSVTLGVVATSNTFSRISIGDKPPKNVTDKKTLSNFSGRELRALSISPGGIYSVLATSKENKPKIEIYNSTSGSVIKKIDHNDLRRMLNSETNSNSYKGFEMFYIYSMFWETRDKLAIIIQPNNPAVESIPVNLTFVYNVKRNKPDRVELHRDQSSVSPVTRGTFYQKSTYSYEVINGKLHIEGNTIQGAPSSIQDADISVITK